MKARLIVFLTSLPLLIALSLFASRAQAVAVKCDDDLRRVAKSVNKLALDHKALCDEINQLYRNFSPTDDRRERLLKAYDRAIKLDEDRLEGLREMRAIEQDRGGGK